MAQNTGICIDIDEQVFNQVYIPYLDCMSRTQIYYGGSSSGKSVFLGQRCVIDVLKGGRNYLVCRAVGRTMRGSVFTEITRLIEEWELDSLFKINKTDMLITCINGYQIIFAGLDDIEKLKSLRPAHGAITDIWVEEATETDKNTIKQLYKRQRGGNQETKKRLTMSFNPIVQNHWIYDEYFTNIAWADDQTVYKDDSLSILKTWYIHNGFLTDDDRADLESEKDPYFYNVYTLGNWGVLGNLIFTNWEVVDFTAAELASFDNIRNGFDFGFAADPAAMSRSHYDRAHKTINIFEEIYEKGLTNDLLAYDVKALIDEEPVACDSAEPKSIAELRQYGVKAYPSKKGKDSVIFGIQWLQQQNIRIASKCVKTRMEFQQAKWEEDKDGTPIRRPVGRNDHIISSLRYAYEREALRTVEASSEQG